MQRIFCARFSSDSKYVLCGSDDMNIRVWTSDASAPIKKLKPREEAGLKYNKKLKDRFKHMPEINRIARHKHLPKAVLSATKLKRTMENAKKRKLSNKRAHAAEGAVPHPVERKKHSVAVVD
jgi:WD repeat and SOF domain-containing protein 1